MAKRIRFPLKMKNGAEVQTLYELRENFDIDSIRDYFFNGKLQIWLSDRYYNEKAEIINQLSSDTNDLNVKLCELFGITSVNYNSDNKAPEKIESIEMNITNNDVKINEDSNFVENPLYFTDYNVFISEYIFYSKERAVIRNILPYSPSADTINTEELRNGVAFEYNEQPLQIIKFNSKANRFINDSNESKYVKCINIITGDIISEVFDQSDSFKTIVIDSMEMLYSHMKNGIYYFKDNSLEKTMSVSYKRLPFSFRFIKEEAICNVLTFNDSIITVLVPKVVDLKVVGFNHNNEFGSYSSTKCAILETGAEIDIPLYIEEGEYIQIDTRTGKFVARVS